MKPLNLDKMELIDQYVEKKFSTAQIALHYKCNAETIRRYLVKFDIKRRRNCPRYKKTIRTFDPIRMSYFAGVVDGEGTITLSQSPGSIGGAAPMLAVKNTDTGLVLWLTKHIGGNVTKDDNSKEENWKPSYRWYNYKVMDVYILTKALYPYLIIKKDNAKAVMRFCELRLRVDKGKSKRKQERSTLNLLSKGIKSGKNPMEEFKRILKLKL